MTKKMKIVWMLMLISSALLLCTLLLPFASANKERRKNMLKDPDRLYVSEVKMSNREAVDISLAEFAKLYYYTAEHGIRKDISISVLVIIAVFAVTALLTLLFSLLRKPVAVIIFSVISMLVFKLIRFDFNDRGVIPGNSFDWGAANCTAYAAGAAAVLFAVFYIIERRKERLKLH